MPRRNLYIIVAIGFLSVICYHRVAKSRYGQLAVDVMNQIKNNALAQPKEKELFEGAISGMVSKLDDPYSEYVPQSDLPVFMENVKREFHGVGMEVDLDAKTGHLVVVAPLVGSPAVEAGVRSGDRILAIDNETTEKMTLAQAIERMRGAPGQALVLTVLHEGTDKPAEIKIVRAVIHRDTVLGDLHSADGKWDYFLPGKKHIGYVRITSFGDRTPEELAKAVRGLLAADMRGLILDLRNNPGGQLDKAVEACRLFVDSGEIVTTRGRDGEVRKRFEAKPGTALEKFPMAVLVNCRSASAAEIMAACLQDHGRAVIIGERTWGKGTVQEIVELGEDLGALKLTVASYWRPSKRNIQRPRVKDGEDPRSANGDWGVKPDTSYEVPVTDADRTQWERWRKQRDRFRPDAKTPEPPADNGFKDRPLEKAVSHLENAAGKK